MNVDAIGLSLMQRFNAEKMRVLREKADLTQAGAGKRAKMSVSRWCDIESGKRINLTIDTLGRVARAIGCNSQDLLTPPKV